MQAGKNEQTTIGIIAHIDAGKTTTTEAILYKTGKIHKVGSVDDGTTEMDYLEEEKQRGITIVSAATTVYWKEEKINIIDTPGHIDFISEVKKSLTVIDGAVLVLCGTAGVQAQTETLYNLCLQDKIPLTFFINKMDRNTSSYDRAFNSLVESFGNYFIPLSLPIFNREEDFVGFYDILDKIYYIYESNNENNKKEPIKFLTFEELPSQYITLKDYNRYIHLFEEKLAEKDEELLEFYLQKNSLSGFEIGKLKRIIKEKTAKREIFPVICGSAIKSIGIDNLLDSIKNFLPKTNEVDYILYTPSDEEVINPNKKVGFIFKTIYDKQTGKLSLVRIYNGNFSKGDKIFNPRKNIWEKISHIYLLHADKKTEIDEAHNGDIIGIIGFKESETGDTILSDKSYLFMHKHFTTEPVINMSIETRFVKDVEPLISALDIISKEDNSFSYKQNKETGQIEISGMGELHLEVIQHRIKNDFKIETRLGNPSIAYRETITLSNSKEIEVSKIIKGVTNHFKLSLSLTSGEENKFIIKTTKIEEQYLSFFENFFSNTFLSGPTYGYPIANLEIILNDFIKFSNDVDILFLGETLKNLFFEIYQLSNPTLLEPVMKLDIIVDENHFSEVINDLNSKKVDIIEMKVLADNSKYKRIIVKGPVSRFFGYSTTLRNLTSGQGYFTMEFLNYEPSSKQI
ncbi:MAG: TetM/TetW/TetO/TetS family tetracycline resistance ribosomal protection protein [Spirochaetales bacterium]|jgi:elongation factor G|nr:TetM/TetW/TetO/TetS family tetracycline resistance ribosomal protection protein [Exilispira sp.]NMC67406.1 TetM/TetW/TetO/TetS family tetracycline resistance ribosomal protection protein [Spirochaetales bacterium]